VDGFDEARPELASGGGALRLGAGRIQQDAAMANAA
jgi:hypothetical protein